MRNLSIATVAALGLMAATASAQMTPSSNQPRTPATNAPATATAPSRPAPNPLAQEDISKIEGTAVYGNDGKKIGRISTVLMNPQSKQVDRLVVDVGGVLGIGGHPVALPVDQFAWNADNNGFKVSQTEAALKQQPEWVDGESTMTGSSIPPKDQSTPASNAGK